MPVFFGLAAVDILVQHDGVREVGLRQLVLGDKAEADAHVPRQLPSLGPCPLDVLYTI